MQDTHHPNKNVHLTLWSSHLRRRTDLLEKVQWQMRKVPERRELSYRKRKTVMDLSMPDERKGEAGLQSSSSSITLTKLIFSTTTRTARLQQL